MRRKGAQTQNRMASPGLVRSGEALPGAQRRANPPIPADPPVRCAVMIRRRRAWPAARFARTGLRRAATTRQDDGPLA